MERRSPAPARFKMRVNEPGQDTGAPSVIPCLPKATEALRLLHTNHAAHRLSHLNLQIRPYLHDGFRSVLRHTGLVLGVAGGDQKSCPFVLVQLLVLLKI